VDNIAKSAKKVSDKKVFFIKLYLKLDCEIQKLVLSTLSAYRSCPACSKPQVSMEIGFYQMRISQIRIGFAFKKH
jgi:hypothetical protein